MDRTRKYRQALIKIVSEYTRLNPSHGHLRTWPLCDETRDHYAIIYSGWHAEDSSLAGPHVQHVTFFACMEDGKIYLEHDGLGEGITDELIHNGVDSDDIVHVWMNPPYHRPVATAAAEAS